MYKKILNVLLHLLFWSFVFIIFSYIFSPPIIKFSIPITGNSIIFKSMALLVLFYINAYLLIPNFLNKSMIMHYSFVVLLLFSSFVFFCYMLNSEFITDKQMQIPIGIEILSFLFVYALSTSYKMICDKIRQEKLVMEKEKESLGDVFNYLPSQINPHFIFHVLNTISDLSINKPEQIGMVVKKLTNIIHYLIYDSSHRISLHKEIEQMKTFLELQQIRFGNEIKVNLIIQENLPDRIIEPMLLIPIVENAFKNGNIHLIHPEISVELGFNKGNFLFGITNKYDPKLDKRMKQSFEIGLSHIKHRLELLYPDNHYFNCYKKNDNEFTVELRIVL
jgi:two-component system, LytTR family, sensor kinase